MAQDGLASFEPAFVDELAVMMRWGFDYMQRDSDAHGDDHTQSTIPWLRDSKGGSVYFRLSTRTVEQIQRPMTETLEHDILAGGYWLRRPGPNPDIVVVAMGAVVPEAIAAVGELGAGFRDIGLLVVTSADRLNAGWSAAERARQRGEHVEPSHIEQLIGALPSHCGMVSVLDGHPATLGWLGSVSGNRMAALGVEHFGQAGSLQDLYRTYRIDKTAITQAAQSLRASIHRPRPSWQR